MTAALFFAVAWSAAPVAAAWLWFRRSQRAAGEMGR